MMTQAHIKEAISIRYMQLIAAYNGYSTSAAHPDYGTDLDIKEIVFRQESAQGRYFESGRELKVQIKSATENTVLVGEDNISYDLAALTYNDLIIRKSSRTPLILVVFVLPDEASQWVTVSDDALICKKCAYWYVPAEGSELTPNLSTKRISIGKENLITTETLGQLFELFA
jgi:hypothetical protein